MNNEGALKEFDDDIENNNKKELNDLDNTKDNKANTNIDINNIDNIDDLIYIYFELMHRQRKSNLLSQHINPNTKELKQVKNKICDVIQSLVLERNFVVNKIETYQTIYLINQFQKNYNRNDYSFIFLLDYNDYYKDVYELSKEDLKYDINKVKLSKLELDQENKEIFYEIEIYKYINYIIQEKYGENIDDDYIDEDNNDNNYNDIENKKLRKLITTYMYDDIKYFKGLQILINFLKLIKKKDDINNIFKAIIKNKDNTNDDNIELTKELLLYIFDDKLNKKLIEDDIVNNYLKNKFAYYIYNNKEEEFHEVLGYLLFYFALFKDNNSIINIYKETVQKLYLTTSNKYLKFACVYALTKYKNNRIICDRADLKLFKHKNKNILSLYRLIQLIYFNRKLRQLIISDSSECNTNNTSIDQNNLANLYITIKKQRECNCILPINLEDYFISENNRHLSIKEVATFIQSYIPNIKRNKTFDFYIFNGFSNKINLLNYKFIDEPPNMLLIQVKLEKFPSTKLQLTPYSNRYYRIYGVLYEDYGETLGYYNVNIKEDLWFDLKNSKYITNIRNVIENQCGISKDIFFLYKLKNKDKFNYTDTFLKEFSSEQDTYNDNVIVFILEFLMIDTKNFINNNWHKFNKFFKRNKSIKKKTIEYFNLYLDDICDTLKNKFGPSGHEFFLNKLSLYFDSIQNDFNDDIVFTDLNTRVNNYIKK